MHGPQCDVNAVLVFFGVNLENLGFAETSKIDNLKKTVNGLRIYVKPVL